MPEVERQRGEVRPLPAFSCLLGQIGRFSEKQLPRVLYHQQVRWSLAYSRYQANLSTTEYSAQWTGQYADSSQTGLTSLGIQEAPVMPTLLGRPYLGDAIDESLSLESRECEESQDVCLCFPYGSWVCFNAKD